MINLALTPSQIRQDVLKTEQELNESLSYRKLYGILYKTMKSLQSYLWYKDSL